MYLYRGQPRNLLGGTLGNGVQRAVFIMDNKSFIGSKVFGCPEARSYNEQMYLEFRTKLFIQIQ